MFSQIHFKISHLHQLVVLDLQSNGINTLDADSRAALDSISKQKDKTMFVRLQRNPFSCACEEVDFLKWFQTSPLFVNRRNSYHCTGSDLIMNESAVKASADDCTKEARRRKKIVLSTVLPTIAVLSTISVLLIWRKQRKRKKYRRLRDERLRQLYENSAQFQYPVFLSYCSEDNVFVYQHVREPLHSVQVI